MRGLLAKFGNPAVIVYGNDAKARSFFPWHRHDRNGEVGIVLLMTRQHLSVIHAIELVAGKNQHILTVILFNVVDILGYGVSGALIPCTALLRGERWQD